LNGNGERIWVQECAHVVPSRREYLRGKGTKLVIKSLPADFEKFEIKELCQENGGKAVDVRRLKARHFRPAAAIVTMSSAEGAAKVFDALHHKEVKKGYTTKTIYYSMDPNALSIAGVPEGVCRADISDFVMEVAGQRPLKIAYRNYDGERAALVVFSKAQTVARCIRRLRNKKLGGERVTLSEAAGLNLSARSITRMAHGTGVRIYDVPEKVTEQTIADHLKKYSKISNAPKSIILEDGKQKSVRVELQSHKDAQLVVDNVNCTEMKGKKCWVEIMMGDLPDKKKKKRHWGQKGSVSNADLGLVNKMAKINMDRKPGKMAKVGGRKPRTKKTKSTGSSNVKKLNENSIYARK